MSKENLEIIIATDCGSTTTKAILIEKKGDTYRQTFRGEAPTTVEAPFEDVTKGVLNAITEVEELSGRRILDGERIITPNNGNTGADIYVSTSSAGGGLQMMVAGAVKAMTGESAQRCALGAGAIVMDVLASNDGRADHEKIERIRQLRPDMMLLSGGTDGGSVTHVVELAQFLKAADPKPRLGASYKLPVIYAGNNKAQPQVKEILDSSTALIVTENLRPSLERENLMPARHKIHDIFLEHVMQQAPGYPKLMKMVGAPIMPTPAAVGVMTEKFAKANNFNVLAVDIGGATTDVFSVFSGVFNRTVSANLGMSYSISNVMAEAGLPNILRWLPFDLEEQDLRNRLKNKMIRPTTIPQTVEDLQVEHAVAREALRLAFDQHKALAVGLKGVQQERSISDAFEQSASGASLINLMDLNYIIGSGGILAHSPRRTQSMLMMIDAYQPEGVTMIAVDSIFMMPHLGVLAQISEKAALDVFYNDCLVRLGTCLAPKGMGKEGQVIMEWELIEENGKRHSGELRFGEILHVPFTSPKGKAIVKPAKGFDMGAGSGGRVEAAIEGGVVGVVLDGRGRPFDLAKVPAKRISDLNKWYKAMEMYPV
ncbi:MAG: methylaspartate mutase [Elusimicrobia bacterium GWA2_56_46]|nr:MAG: methylaspartate mutase [Elusimicrobia bacterium GWA2_56_46]OGR54731.1 MAG: methylaspartate mutase [Elusimicrobia bacterium GWC2_56_31]HBW23481.1 methylaspartate mutase [Elusimicrobiota bacterium]